MRLRLVGETSATRRRLCTSTWVAANPMPGAAYIVSNMSAINARSASSTTVDRSGFCPEPGIREFENL